MSDFMALLISHQNERETELALERRRLQRESAATAQRSPRPWHRLRGVAVRQEQTASSRVQTSH
ncbi:hypothetical protein MB46_08015 [Arthrobacter alpinus]|uniref:hypothetical protein n=1 Tax=Arthrobacter alpinus TaxID=656366 RepID=UPI0005CA9925|nr:hypothetical protein [Arthrobacter alpinus]ALV45440.1 hypothetical protein MB46_08015 [Arthrobacter alpinus]